MLLTTAVCVLLSVESAGATASGINSTICCQDSALEEEAIRFLRVTGVKPDAVRADIENRSTQELLVSFGSEVTGGITLSSVTGKVTSFYSTNGRMASEGHARPRRNVFASEAAAIQELKDMALAIGLPSDFQLVSFTMTEDKYRPGDYLFDQGRAIGTFANPGTNVGVLNAAYYATILLDIYDGSLSGFGMSTRIVKVDRPVNVTEQQARQRALEFASEWLSQRGLSVREVLFGYAIPERRLRPPLGSASMNACSAWEVVFNDQHRSSVIIDANTGQVAADRRKG